MRYSAMLVMRFDANCFALLKKQTFNLFYQVLRKKQNKKNVKKSVKKNKRKKQKRRFFYKNNVFLHL